MYNHEELARTLKKQGNNCSESLYKAFKRDIELGDEYPMPRGIDGKCGALLTAIKILEETGNTNEIKEFEAEFENKFGYTKCVDLMTHERKCSDYVGESAKFIDKVLNKNEDKS